MLGCAHGWANVLCVQSIMLRSNNAHERKKDPRHQPACKICCCCWHKQELLEICAMKAVAGTSNSYLRYVRKKATIPVLTGHCGRSPQAGHTVVWPIMAAAQISHTCIKIVGLVRCDGGMATASCPKRLQASTLLNLSLLFKHWFTTIQ